MTRVIAAGAGLVAVLIAPGAAFADEAEVAGEVIVVTGTRSEAPLAASPVPTEVIDRRRLEESGAQTVSEALTLRAGLWIDRGVAGTSGLTMQGLGPKYSLVLVDGVRQIGRTDGYLDLDRFGIAEIEQIEIVRGPSSALYGADALGGVVNIITRRPKDGLAIDLLGRIDGRLASDARARISLGARGTAGAVFGEYRAGDAIRRDGATVATTIDSYTTQQIGARIAHEASARWELGGDASYLRRDLGGVDASASGAVFDRRNLVESAAGGATAAYTAGPAAARFAATASVYRDQYLSDQRASNALDTYQVTDESLGEASAQVVRQAGAHRVLVGAELVREALSSERLAEPGSRVRSALFAQDEWRAGAGDDLIFVAGARFDHDTQFGRHVTPRIAARWRIAPAVIVRGSAGLGYRAPDFKELLLHFENASVGYVVDGNPDLQPETSRSLQAGTEWQPTGWLWLSLGGYYNGLHDLIHATTKPDDGSGMVRFGYANLGRARTAGIDGAATITRGRAGLELGYALTHARDLDDERPLEGVPAHRLTATARWRDGAQGFDAFAALVVTGHRPYYLAEDPQLATPSPRRIEIRARIAKRFRGGYGGFLGVDNLLDAGDATLDRIPPRTFYAGAELHR